MRFLFVILALFLAGPAQAALPDCLSEAEFRALAAELATKVNLFAEAWKQDPAAEFYGGTTRDYLYWIKGKFQTCRDPAEGRRIADELRKESVIDVREFIIGDSDVDVVSKGYVRIDPATYGIKKIDSISPEIFDPATDKGMNETVQGYIPAEKIRLQQGRLAEPAHFGDGLAEIYSGKLTVHFTTPEVFARGHYAKAGINHPILLALRYQRLLGINYFRTYGTGYPEKEKLFDIDPASAKKVKEVVDQAVSTGELKAFLEKDQFRRWLNGAIQKSFRSYTNPTAAKLLLQHFGVNLLAGEHPEIEPINQYVFRRYRDEATVKKNLAKMGAQDGLFRPLADSFPDGFLYHGTRTEEAFRGILLQGFLPSEIGVGGAGLYGVGLSHRSFAEDWGGSPDRTLRIPVLPTAKLVDVTEGEGARLWKKYAGQAGHTIETFADDIGADIVRYPYEPTVAFVVKNSAALGRPEGLYRKILTLSEARELARKVQTAEGLLELSRTFALNHFNAEETKVISAEVKDAEGLIRGLTSTEDGLQKVLRLKEDEARALWGLLPPPRWQALQNEWLDGPWMKSRLRRPTSGTITHQLGDFFQTDNSIAIQFYGEALKRFRDYLRREVPPPSLVQLHARHAIDEDLREAILLLMAQGKASTTEIKSLLREWHTLRHHDIWVPLTQFFGTSTGRDFWPEFRQHTIDRSPARPVGETYVKRQGSSASFAATLESLVRDNARPAEIEAFVRAVEGYARTSEFYVTGRYMSTPTGRRDPELWKALFATNPENTEATSLIYTGLREFAKDPLKELANGEVLEKLLERTRYGGLGDYTTPLEQILDETIRQDPPGAKRALRAFFKKDPSSFMAAGDSRLPQHAEMVLAVLLDRAEKIPGFFADGVPEAWISTLLNNFRYYQSASQDQAVRTLGALLARPEVFCHRRGTEWMQKYLARDIFLLEKNRDKFVEHLLDRPPWRDHPARAVWLKSMELKTGQFLERIIRSGNMIYPREKYIRTRLSFDPSYPVRVALWRKKAAKAMPIDLTGWSDRQGFALTTCPSRFQRLFLRHGSNAN